MVDKIKELEGRISALEQENKQLRERTLGAAFGDTVKVPPQIRPLFDIAQKTVGEYFNSLRFDPSQANIQIEDQRYLLVRASSLSYDFLRTIKDLYADRGEQEALIIGKNFLFDISHVIGMDDAKNFHKKMNLTDPISKMSAGPVHFAYTGWAFVDILEESKPSADNDFFLKYHHPFSFEADSWIKAGQKANAPVCIMNAGYSSGWCEESFGIPLTAVEISCKAKGDDNCTFIMAPPHRVEEHIKKHLKEIPKSISKKTRYDIPTFFERKKVEEEMKMARIKAEESDRAKTEFLANISHEIRTPLNAILGFIQIMLKDNPAESHREYLEIARNSGQLLENIINDILDLSKIDAGQLLINSEPYSLQALRDHIDGYFKSLFSQKGQSIRVKSNFSGKISEYIRTDPIRLKQIMNNLISNALKFTDEGYIEYGATLQDGAIEFYVEDTGIGIPEEKQATVFNKFEQADTTNTREYGGTGLGLTITKKLVELMGGKIWLESKMNQGTICYFTIPYHPAEAGKTSHAGPATITGPSQRNKLLLVEDNLINQQLAKLILEKAGYDVVTAANGEEAIKIFDTDPSVDLIIMDIQMPVLDGLEAAKRIRKQESNNEQTRTPIIALTAHAMRGDMEKCLDAGCDCYLTKPVVMDELVEKVKEHIH